MVKIKLVRKQSDYGFDAIDSNNILVKTDSNLENGGQNYGARPMQLLLTALGSCSAIDIVSILKKQRQVIDDFTIEINGEREKNVEPALWEIIHVQYNLEGNIEIDKAQKACILSIDKYCSVAETLRRAGARITWEVTVNNNLEI